MTDPSAPGRSRPLVSALLSGVAWLALAGAPAAAAADPPVAAGPPVAARAYTLAAGDRVAITVFGQPELSGDFLIDGAGELLLSLVGPVPAADATLGELQKRIVERLADGYMQDPKVSVRIAEFRPIYIVGNVRSPGSYPFRYGMSVLTALALAGGVSVPTDRQESLRNEIAQADERLAAVTAGYQALLARRSRLAAQRDAAGTIAFPATIQAEGATPHLQEIMEGERAILGLQRRLQAQKLELLREQMPRAKAEAQAIAAQRRLERVQLDLVQAQVADMNKLTASGLARRASLVELQREAARIEGNIAKLAVDAARVEQLLGEIDGKIQEVTGGYRERVMVELQETQARLMEVEANLLGARESRDIKLLQAGLAAGRPRPLDDPGAVSILAYEKDAVATRPASETTLLRPGDIVRVGSMVREPARAPGGPAVVPPAAPAIAPPAAPAIGPLSGSGVPLGAR